MVVLVAAIHLMARRLVSRRDLRRDAVVNPLLHTNKAVWLCGRGPPNRVPELAGWLSNFPTASKCGNLPDKPVADCEQCRPN